MEAQLLEIPLVCFGEMQFQMETKKDDIGHVLSRLSDSAAAATIDAPQAQTNRGGPSPGALLGTRSMGVPTTYVMVRTLAVLRSGMTAGTSNPRRLGSCQRRGGGYCVGISGQSRRSKPAIRGEVRSQTPKPPPGRVKLKAEHPQHT